MAKNSYAAEQQSAERQPEERNEYGHAVGASRRGKPGGRSLTATLPARSSSKTSSTAEPTSSQANGWWDDLENPRYFLDTFSYYVGSGYSGVAADRQDQGDAAMDNALDGVRDIAQSLGGGRDAGSTGFSQWEGLRPRVQAVLTRYGNLADHDDATVSRAADYLRRLDATIVARRMKLETEAGIGDVEMASPENGFYAVEANLLGQAIDGIIGTEGIYEKLRASLVNMGREDAVAQLKSSAGAGMSGLNTYRDFVKATDLGAKLKEAHAAGKLKEAMTVGDFLRVALELCKDVCQTIFRIAEVVARPSMPEAAKAAAELSYSLNRVAFVRLATGAVAVVQIIVGAAKLFVAIAEGKTEEIVSASHDILQGTWTLVAVILNLPTAVIAGVGGTLYLWYQGVLMFGQLGGVLAHIKDQAVLDAIRRVVELGADTANDGLAMASAWQRFLETGAKQSPSELQEQLTQAFKVEADTHLKKVRDGLRNIRSEVESTDRRAVGGHSDLIAEFGNDARAATSTGTLDPMTAAEQCNAVFLAIDRVGRYAREHYAR
jgi:hypothetical protein